MVVQPKYRNNIFINSHPVGCAAEVKRQIDWVRRQRPVSGPKRVLVVGSSTGYGLAARIVAAFGGGARTIGVAFEKEGSEKRTGTAGWYNTRAFDEAAKAAGVDAISFNGDAFSDAVKQEVVDAVKEKLGRVDLVVYSLASPVRTDPKTGEMYRSVLKPIGRALTTKSVNIDSGEVSEVTIDAATGDEIEQTRKVMGGEDWALWIDALASANLLADGATTVAFSYIGPAVTAEVYRKGTIGKAKEDLENTAHRLNEKLSGIKGRAFVSVNKAVVTRSSAVIPNVPLYVTLLFRIMKDLNIHEGCIEQMQRMFAERLYAGDAVPVDDEGRIRMDDLEMRDDVQAAVADRWRRVSTENFEQLADADGYRRDFMQIHGFDVPGVDYDADVET